MLSAMLVAAIGADALAAATGTDVHAVSHPRPTFVALPMASVAAWPMRRCGDGVPGTYEATADGAIDGACARLVVHDRAPERIDDGRHARSGGAGGGGSSAAGLRIARAVLPGLQGLVGPGGMGLGIGSELQFVRGAHMTLHLAAARDTRIADTMFAPETTVLARCGACWTESEAAGAGLTGARRSPVSVAVQPPRLSRAAPSPSSAARGPTP